MVKWWGKTSQKINDLQEAANKKRQVWARHGEDNSQELDAIGVPNDFDAPRDHEENQKKRVEL